MKPTLLKVFKDDADSFSARHVAKPDVNNHWHYHIELELVHFKSGHGTQFIGDNISSFNSGDIVLVGSNLPHYWQFDEVYFQTESASVVDVSVVHFNANFWGETFINLPENKALREVIERSNRGLQLSNPSTSLGDRVEKIVSLQGSRKIISLIEILLDIKEAPQTKILASMGFHHNFNENEKDRINAIYNYTIANFRKSISLQKIAEVAAMSPNSFCKYFKSKSNKTYTEFVNEIRIGQACKLLIDSNYNIKEVCYLSGFNNFSSFHKFFKMMKGKSPLAYQKDVRAVK